MCFELLLIPSDICTGLVVVTTSAKPLMSPFEKLATTSSVTPSQSSEEEEEEDEEEQASNEQGEFNKAKSLS